MGTTGGHAPDAAQTAADRPGADVPTGTGGTGGSGDAGTHGDTTRIKWPPPLGRLLGYVLVYDDGPPPVVGLGGAIRSDAWSAEFAQRMNAASTGGVVMRRGVVYELPTGGGAPVEPPGEDRLRERIAELEAEVARRHETPCQFAAAARAFARQRDAAEAAVERVRVAAEEWADDDSQMPKNAAGTRLLGILRAAGVLDTTPPTPDAAAPDA